MNWNFPIPDANDYYECRHPDYYKQNIVTGRVTYYNCGEMRRKGPCGTFDAKLFEAK